MSGFDTRWDEVSLSFRKDTSRRYSGKLAYGAHTWVCSTQKKPYWQHVNKRTNNISQNWASRNRRPWWRNVWISASEPAIFKSEMKESRKEDRRKAKGNFSALKGSKEDAVNGKQKESATKGDACSFRHDDNKPQTKSDGKFFDWTVSQRSESVWEEISKIVQRLHFRKHTNASCDYWHKTESGCSFCKYSQFSTCDKM